MFVKLYLKIKSTDKNNINVIEFPKETKERIDAANAKEKEGDGERVEGCSCLGEFYICFFFFPIFSSKSNTHLTILIF